MNKPTLEGLKNSARTGRRCMVCKHPERKFIEEARAAGFGPSVIFKYIQEFSIDSPIDADSISSHFRRQHEQKKS